MVSTAGMGGMGAAMGEFCVQLVPVEASCGYSFIRDFPVGDGIDFIPEGFRGVFFKIFFCYIIHCRWF